MERSRVSALSASRDHATPDDLRNEDRNDDVETDREKQGFPRHGDRREAEQKTDDRSEGEHHDDVVERDLAQREMRLAVREVAPDEDHGRARRCREQDEAGDVAVNLVRWQIRSEELADKEPAQQRHRERLHGPVDEERDADAAPMLAHLRRGREVDLYEHRDDHQPDQDRNGQIDLGDLG